MSLSITLTSEDTNKLIDTAYLLDLLFTTLGPNDTISVPTTVDTSYNYTSEEIRELSSWYKNIVEVLRYNNYDVDLSNDEDYLASLTA
jgi:hypothetical protein